VPRQFSILGRRSAPRSKTYQRLVATTSAAAAILICGYIAIAGSNFTVVRPANPIPTSYFDMNILFHPLNKVPWPAVPFYGWRMSHVNWPDLEPQRGQWNFALLDKYVDWAQEHNTELMMTMTYTPPWTSTVPNAPSDFSTPGYGGPPSDIEDWRTFVRTVATRYKGRIHLYEMWNEPDRRQSWVGDVDTMVEMVREASRILKEIDPSVTVISPCPTYGRGPAWLNEFLNKGGGQYVDVIGYHFYTGHNDGPEAVVPLIQAVKKVMWQNHVGNKPLWDTEAGWLGANPFPEDQQAAYLARAYVLNWAAQVDRFYWYAWENHHGTQIELIRSDNAALTPAGQAFATIQQWMVGASMSECLASENGDWVCEMKRDGANQYIVWNTGGSRSFRLSRDWHASQYTQLNAVVNKISGDSIPIGIQPELIQ
jgi:hypothetical protein